LTTAGDATAGCEPYNARNLLDRVSRRSTLEVHYDQMMLRERQLLARRLAIPSGDVLSVGCGWHPGRGGSRGRSIAREVARHQPVVI